MCAFPPIFGRLPFSHDTARRRETVAGVALVPICKGRNRDECWKGYSPCSNCPPVSTVRHRTRGVGPMLVSSAVHLLVLVGIMAVPLLPPTGRRVSEVTELSFSIKRT